jgi:hypothetical protein
VTVCQDANEKVTILFKDTPLVYSVFHKQEHQSQVVPAKQIDRIQLNQSKAHKPAPNHPWRSSMVSK